MADLPDSAIEALLEQRQDQGYDTPSQAVIEQLTQLLAGVGVPNVTPDREARKAAAS